MYITYCSRGVVCVKVGCLGARSCIEVATDECGKLWLSLV
jgi:hypothetical protein